ncbi:MAG TPA: hypothetical protein VGR78_03935 [Verrucomicrobiae bacterium]|jgi:hypothetical protein|nr:hypothetical protein [Verrucomicrobiae bacterium]
MKIHKLRSVFQKASEARNLAARALQGALTRSESAQKVLEESKRMYKTARKKLKAVRKEATRAVAESKIAKRFVEAAEARLTKIERKLKKADKKAGPKVKPPAKKPKPNREPNRATRPARKKPGVQKRATKTRPTASITNRTVKMPSDQTLVRVAPAPEVVPTEMAQAKA